MEMKIAVCRVEATGPEVRQVIATTVRLWLEHEGIVEVRRTDTMRDIHSPLTEFHGFDVPVLRTSKQFGTIRKPRSNDRGYFLPAHPGLNTQDASHP